MTDSKHNIIRIMKVLATLPASADNYESVTNDNEL